MNYELFSKNFPLFLQTLVISLTLTVFFYGIGPFFYWKIKGKTATVRTLRRFCIFYTILIWIIFRIILGGISYAPAFLWGIVFYRIYRSKIVSKEEPQINHSSELENETNKPSNQSFYEKEKNLEAEKNKKFSPLDPPEKTNLINKTFLFHVLSVGIIICLGGMLIYSAYKTSTLKKQLSDVSELQKEYDSLQSEYYLLKSEHESLLVEHATMESEYNLIDLRFTYETERSRFLMNRIGFIVPYSTYYHSYDCDEFINADEFWAHNIEYCEYLGYYQCPNCW